MQGPGFVNPIDVFGPILQQTLQDTQSLVTREIRDPFPIVRAGLLDLTSIFGVISPVPQPGPGVGNAYSAPTGAVTGGPLQNAAGGPLAGPPGGVVTGVQGFLQRQLTIAMQLATTLPSVGIDIGVSVVNSVVRSAMALIRAGMGVVTAAATLDPVRVFNSVVNGTALVAKVVEETTIGGRQFNKTTVVGNADTAPSVDASRSIGISRIPSIAVAINTGRQRIASVLLGERALTAQAPVTGAQLAAPSDTGTPAASSTAAATPAAKAAASSTTAETPAAKVANKPTVTKAAADEVKSTPASEQKSATGGSTSAAK